MSEYFVFENLFHLLFLSLLLWGLIVGFLFTLLRLLALPSYLVFATLNLYLNSPLECLTVDQERTSKRIWLDICAATLTYTNIAPLIISVVSFTNTGQIQSFYDSFYLFSSILSITTFILIQKFYSGDFLKKLVHLLDIYKTLIKGSLK